MTKSRFLSTVAERAGMTRKDADAMWDAVCATAAEQLRAAGTAVLPGLIRMSVKDVPATPERKGRHPFTGKDHVFPAKPASKRLKATVPKAFKDAVLG